MNKINCNNCEHMKLNDDKTLHCYMFKNEPIGVCMAFKNANTNRIFTGGFFRPDKEGTDFSSTLISLLKEIKK